MAWTLNGNRSNDPRSRRRQVELEQLDSRLLLSRGVGASLPNPGAAQFAEAAHRSRIVAAHANNPVGVNTAANARIHLRVNMSTNGSPSRPGAAALASRAPGLARASLARTTETPVGSVAVGTPTAFDPIIGAAATRQQYNIDGSGMTVAVIDTGVDYNNKALGGGFGAGAKVIAGYDFASGRTDPMATTSQHGTSVAGLIGGDDASHLGVAPGVDVVALKVTGDDNAANLDSIASALQWVVDHHSEYNITVVNMSLSNGGNYAGNWFAQDGGVGQKITGLVQQLKGMNIPVVAATGNSFKGQQGEGFTAIVGGVISVTATDVNDNFVANAQRLGSAVGGASATVVAAPGAGIVAPSGDSGYATVDGTSFAAPLVSGSVVLLQQLYASRYNTLPTVDQITGWLQQGAKPVYDPATGATIGRLDVAKSASLVPGASATPPVVTPPVATPPAVTPPVVTPPVVTPPVVTPPVVTPPVVTPPVVTPPVVMPPVVTPPVVTPPVVTPPVVMPPVATPSVVTPPVVTPPVVSGQVLDVALVLNGRPLSSNQLVQAASSSSLGTQGMDRLVQAMNRWADASDGTRFGGRVRAWNVRVS